MGLRTRGLQLQPYNLQQSWTSSGDSKHSIYRYSSLLKGCENSIAGLKIYRDPTICDSNLWRLAESAAHKSPGSPPSVWQRCYFNWYCRNELTWFLLPWVRNELANERLSVWLPGWNSDSFITACIVQQATVLQKACKGIPIRRARRTRSGVSISFSLQEKSTLTSQTSRHCYQKNSKYKTRVLYTFYSFLYPSLPQF